MHILWHSGPPASRMPKRSCLSMVSRIKFSNSSLRSCGGICSGKDLSWDNWQFSYIAILIYIYILRKEQKYSLRTFHLDFWAPGQAGCMLCFETRTCPLHRITIYQTRVLMGSSPTKPFQTLFLFLPRFCVHHLQLETWTSGQGNGLPRPQPTTVLFFGYHVGQ